MTAPSKTRSSCVEVMAAKSTTSPAAIANRNTNSTARETWSEMRLTCPMIAVRSITLTLGKRSTRRLTTSSRPAGR
jgi:hypothetical protein